ncbi:MAG TPA: hypothetical protein VMY37_04515 [Thermoguttaceae bacterium]|nr:hypothetical protein [Thermoguttaceae bacterium]
MARARIIDYRRKIGSESWKEMPRKSRRLSLWRRAHMFGGHPPVSSHAKKLGLPSSKSLSMPQLRKFIRVRETGKARQKGLW